MGIIRSVALPDVDSGAVGSAMSDITWANERRKLSELKPREDNPRIITKAQAERLVKSFDKFAQVETLAVNPDGRILNGH